MNYKAYDPYDFKFSYLGNIIFKLYYRFGFIILPLILIGEIMTGVLRIFKILKKREYPIVLAFSGLTYLLDNNITKIKNIYYSLIKHEIRLNNGSVAYGLNVNFPISKDLKYSKDSTFVVITIYVYRFFIELSKHKIISDIDEKIYEIESYFVDNVKFELHANNTITCSYSEINDRTVLNSVAYVLDVYETMKKTNSKCFLENTELIENRIKGLKKTIIINQQIDGSWNYSLSDKTFKDCFHSCFILEVLIKNYADDNETNKLILKGYNYLIDNHYDKKLGVLTRYPSETIGLKGLINKLQLSLYDSAEFLNITFLLNKKLMMKDLVSDIDSVFKNKSQVLRILRPNPYGADWKRWGIVQYNYYKKQIEKN